MLDALHAEAVNQQTEYAEKIAATSALQAAFEEAWRAFSIDRAIAKKLFKGNSDAWRRLGLDKPKANRQVDQRQQIGSIFKIEPISPNSL